MAHLPSELRFGWDFSFILLQLQFYSTFFRKKRFYISHLKNVPDYFLFHRNSLFSHYLFEIHMKPIDKFDWQNNYATCQHLLEYITWLDKLYVPSRWESPDANFGHMAQSSSGHAAMDEIVLPISDTERIFIKRYEDQVFPSYLDYDTYCKHKTIQMLIKELDFDKDCLWMALLFTYDYCVNQCLTGKVLKESASEQIDNLIAKLSEDASLSITVSNGKKKDDVHIDNPAAIDFILSTLMDKVKTINIDNCQHLIYHEIEDETAEVKESVYITYFAKMLLSLFDCLPQVSSKRKPGARYSQNEKDLVCQFIYFAHISRNKSWSYTLNENLKSYLRQYDRPVVTANSVYPLFNI